MEKHAWEGMMAERPPIKVEHTYAVLSEGTRVETRQGHFKAWKRIEGRTIIVYYDEEEAIYVTGVSVTRRKI